MLEENKIYNMDCLEGLRQIRTGSVQAIITDPPYFQGLTQNGQRGDFADLTITKPFWKSLAREIARVLKPDGEFYIFMDWRGYAFYYTMKSRGAASEDFEMWLKSYEWVDAFDTTVSRSVIVERASIARVPVTSYSPRCKVAKQYAALAAEIVEVLK